MTQDNSPVFHPEALEVILSSPELAYECAYDIIQGPWPLGEPIIFSDAVFQHLYIENILKSK